MNVCWSTSCFCKIDVAFVRDPLWGLFGLPRDVLTNMARIMLTELRSLIADELDMMMLGTEAREYAQLDAGVAHDPDWVASYPEDEGHWPPPDREDASAADVLEPDEIEELEATTDRKSVV